MLWDLNLISLSSNFYHLVYMPSIIYKDFLNPIFENLGEKKKLLIRVKRKGEKI